MKLLLKIAVVVAVLAGFVYLFLRTAHDARSQSYVIERAHLQGWTISVESADGPSSPLVVARPSQELSAGIFRQVFARMMESMRGSTEAAVPLVLRGEYEMSLAASFTPEELADIARTAGLDRATLVPSCVAIRRISQPGVTRQLYFILFDSPAFTQFREQIGSAAANMPSAMPFDPSALAPVMIVAASDAAFDSWLPIGPEARADCIAPVQIE